MPINPIVAAAGIGAGASLLGSAGSAAASAKEAKKNREFQEEMSNTAFQRSAADLEAAGLNRILALGSPATTPGGAMGQVPDYGSAIAQGANAGIAGASGASSISLQEKQGLKILQETKVLNQKEKQELEKTKMYQTFVPIMAKAGDNFDQLTKMMTDTEFLKSIAGSIAAATKDQVTYMAKLVAEKYNQSEQVIFNALEHIGSKITNRKVEIK